MLKFKTFIAFKGTMHCQYNDNENFQFCSLGERNNISKLNVFGNISFDLQDRILIKLELSSELLKLI